MKRMIAAIAVCLLWGCGAGTGSQPVLIFPPEGASVPVPNSSVTLFITPGAVPIRVEQEYTTNITLTPAPAGVTMVANSGVLFLSRSFLVPIFVRYNYETLGVAAGSASNLRIYKRPRFDAAWVEQATNLDTVSKVVSCQTDSFSEFAVGIVQVP